MWVDISSICLVPLLLQDKIASGFKRLFLFHIIEILIKHGEFYCLLSMGEKLNFDLWEFLLAINFQTSEIDLPNKIWDGL